MVMLWCIHISMVVFARRIANSIDYEFFLHIGREHRERESEREKKGSPRHIIVFHVPANTRIQFA